jgi:signal transduction histidine kinase
VAGLVGAPPGAYRSAGMDLRALYAPRTLEAVAYVALSWVVGAIVFWLVFVLVVVSVPFMFLALAGLPILWLAFLVAHGVALMEGNRAGALLGADFRVRPLNRRPFAAVRARGAWLELCYSLVALPFVGLVGGLLVFFALGAALAGLTFPIWGWAAAGNAGLGLPASMVVHFAFGVALLLAAPYLARGVASVQLAMARLLLEPGANERLTARVDTLEETRAGMVAAADAERRRIERDLHDGAQQRLVALALTLGRAKASEDPQLSKRLLDEAHGEAKEALVELRNLARGIHPAVLTDRGLDAAVSALAARCPVPVAVDVDLPHRAGPSTEAIAYFVVAEALTNVAKHSQATRAWLTVGFEADDLFVEILDNGRGGANGAGNGLAGLRDRVRAVDGHLTLTSPPGGGTTLRVELPCGP